MIKFTKYASLLLLLIMFLTACSSNTSNEEQNWNSQPKQETDNSSIEEKINNKQKYIVLQKDTSDDIIFQNGTVIEKYIEENTNSMYLKNYQLIQQNITSTRLGYPRYIILTFEYKGD